MKKPNAGRKAGLVPMEVRASCLCGAVTIACGEPLGPGAYCHCADCRKVTGSAFGVNIPFDAAQFRVLSGEIGSFTKTADSGNELTRFFCRNCGSPLYGLSPQHPGRIYVRAGVLDDSSFVRPAYESWCQSRVDWSVPGPDLPAYAKDRSSGSG